MIEFKHGIFSLLFVSIEGQSHACSNEWVIDHVSRFKVQRVMCNVEAVERLYHRDEAVEMRQ
jgi:hypothetical protein